MQCAVLGMGMLTQVGKDGREGSTINLPQPGTAFGTHFLCCYAVLGHKLARRTPGCGADMQAPNPT